MGNVDGYGDFVKAPEDYTERTEAGLVTHEDGVALRSNALFAVETAEDPAAVGKQIRQDIAHLADVDPGLFVQVVECVRASTPDHRPKRLARQDERREEAKEALEWYETHVAKRLSLSFDLAKREPTARAARKKLMRSYDKAAAESMLWEVPVHCMAPLRTRLGIDRQEALDQLRMAYSGGAEAELQDTLDDGSLLGMLPTDKAGNIKPTDTTAYEVMAAGSEFVRRLTYSVCRGHVEWDGDILEDPIPQIRRAFGRYGIEMGRNTIKSELVTAAKLRPRNHLQEYLELLIWDGTPRLETMLIDHMAAPDTPIVRIYCKRWMIGLVARPCKPGCQMDSMLVLLGNQGGGKTTFGRMLVGDDEYVSGGVRPDGHDKDQMMKLSRGWLVEVGELDQYTRRRAEQSKLKDFVSGRADHFRAPYDSAIREYKRSCAFLGTTNEDQPLSDPTGGRRFFCVPVGRLNRETFGANRDQLLAEAYSRFKSGEQWWLTEAEAELARADTAERTVEYVIDPLLLSDWLEDEVLRSHRTYVRTVDVVTGFLGGKPEDEPKHRNKISRSLEKLGWRKSRQQIQVGAKKVRVTAWMPPD